MTDAPGVRPERTRLVRILAYYVVLAGVLFVLARTVPEVRHILGSQGIQSLAASNPFGDASAAVGAVAEWSNWTVVYRGVACMLGALLIMIPVTWIYTITRRHRGYEEAVVHSLLILPVAVTGIVMVVQYSLAIAFSLAGIVAAVRFRTTLEDTKDAVYIFLAIGVGVACGVPSVGLALLLSIMFNAVVLVLWATRFGNPYAAAAAGGSIGLGDAQVGYASSETRRLVGDGALLDAAAPRDIAQALDRAARLEHHLSGERGKKKSKRSNTLLLLSTRELAGAQAAVEAILSESAERWSLAEVLNVEGGGWVMEYLARVAPGTEGPLVERLRAGAPGVTAVELRSLQRLKGRE